MHFAPARGHADIFEPFDSNSSFVCGSKDALLCEIENSYGSYNRETNMQVINAG